VTLDDRLRKLMSESSRGKGWFLTLAPLPVIAWILYEYRDWGVFYLVISLAIFVITIAAGIHMLWETRQGANEALGEGSHEE